MAGPIMAPGGVSWRAHRAASSAPPAVVAASLTELPQPYAYWLQGIADAKAALDGLLQHGLAGADAEMAYGCIHFVVCASSGACLGYPVRPPRGGGDLGGDLLHVRGIGLLAMRLLKREFEVARAQGPQELREPLLIQGLCRACSGCCGEVLRELPREVLCT